MGWSSSFITGCPRTLLFLGYARTNHPDMLRLM
jgi:hypothetical protein